MEHDISWRQIHPRPIYNWLSFIWRPTGNDNGTERHFGMRAKDRKGGRGTGEIKRWQTHGQVEIEVGRHRSRPQWYLKLTSWPGRWTQSRSACRTRPLLPVPHRQSRLSMRHLHEPLGFSPRLGQEHQSSGETGSVVDIKNIVSENKRWQNESGNKTFWPGCFMSTDYKL